MRERERERGGREGVLGLGLGALVPLLHLFPGSQETGTERSVVPQEKGILRRLKEVFWKEEEEGKTGESRRQGSSQS